MKSVAAVDIVIPVSVVERMRQPLKHNFLKLFQDHTHAGKVYKQLIPTVH
jgi:hypothetical protein